MSRISNCRTSPFLCNGYRSPLMAPISDPLPTFGYSGVWTYYSNIYYPTNQAPYGSLPLMPIPATYFSQRSTWYSFYFSGNANLPGDIRCFENFYNGRGDHQESASDYPFGIASVPSSFSITPPGSCTAGAFGYIKQNGITLASHTTNDPSIPFYQIVYTPSPIAWYIEKGCYRVDVSVTLGSPAVFKIQATTVAQNTIANQIVDSRLITGTSSYSFDLYLRSNCEWQLNWTADGYDFRGYPTSVSIALTWFGFT